MVKWAEIKETWMCVWKSGWREEEERVILFECIFNYPRLVLLHQKGHEAILNWALCPRYCIASTVYSHVCVFVCSVVYRRFADIFSLCSTVLYQLKISIQLRQLHGHVFPIYVIVVIGIVVTIYVYFEHCECWGCLRPQKETKLMNKRALSNDYK